MSQPKVYEYAKELGMETLVLMDKIRKWNIPVKSHMAALSEENIDQIQLELKAEMESSSDKKKKKKAKAKKKAKKKATTSKKKTTKKVTSKIAKPVTRKKKAATTTKVKVEAEKEAAPEAEAAPTKKKVIRRKASDVTAAKIAAEAVQSQQAQAKAEEAAAAAAEAGETINVEAPTVEKAAKGRTTATKVEGATPAPGEAKPTAPRGAQIKPTGKIIGRMDLSKVPGRSGSGNSRPGNRPQTSTTATRSIRPGFVAQSPSVNSGPGTTEFDRNKEREKAKPKKPGVGASKDAPVAHFAATEFRKREVIFQPKKKRVFLGVNKKTQLTTPAAHKRVVRIFGEMSIAELANQFQVKSKFLVKKLIKEGVMVKMTDTLDFDTISLIAPEFGFEVENATLSVDEMLDQLAFGTLDAEPVSRPPVVTVMGHVDHGKTTLLDAIRKADVVSGEAGGITQHIGAYKVQYGKGREATFIDTPGHAAFTAMRARGANVTDIVIVVVAADDGVMPQTEEAINHAKSAGVPIIVAVNKIDRPGANIDKIKQQMTEYELVPEEWGGDTMFCEVSALKKEGIDNLLDQVYLLSEVLELKANKERSAQGIVIESRVEKGKGNVATVLVQQGTLKKGDVIVAGQVIGKIRRMSNERGDIKKEVFPSEPVEITGLPSTPSAGDRFDVCKKESAALEIVEARKKQSSSGGIDDKTRMDDIFKRVLNPNIKDLSIVLKVDVAGSSEAIKGMFSELENDEVNIKVIHSAVGLISESDVLLASTAGGIVFGFNTKADNKAQKVAKEKGVDIRSYSIIYELIDDIKLMMSGLLTPDVVETPLGRAEVRNTFSVPRIGTIAGCLVVEGKVIRNGLARLTREGTTIHEGNLSSLKRFKDDAKEVKSGVECGIGIEGFTAIHVGDVIEVYEKKEIAREIDTLITEKTAEKEKEQRKKTEAEAEA